jgi:hypothetical protein
MAMSEAARVSPASASIRAGCIQRNIGVSAEGWNRRGTDRR